jgi:PAS domain S-box-containing protein
VNQDRLSVLIVDDDEDFGLTLRDVLTDHLPGTAVAAEHVLTYAAGVERLLAGAHDVALLDYRLGPDDGIDLLVDVRARGVLTPVIVMTGWSDEAVVVRAMKAGATDYLSKAKLSGGAVAAAVRHCVAIAARDRLHRRAQEEVQASEQRFRTVFDEAPIGMMLLDEAGAVFRANAALCAMLGRSEAELIAGGLAPCIHPDDRAATGEHTERLLRGEVASYSLETRFFAGGARDGDVVWGEVTARAIRSPDGAVRERIVMIENVTVRKQAEEALRATGHLLEEAQAIAHVGSWSSGVGPTDELIWSRECYRIFGVPPGRTMTVDGFFACVHPEDREIVQRASTAAIERGLPYDIEHRVLWPDGSTRWVHERAVVERDAAGRTVRLIGSAQDITDRRVAADALRRTEEQFRQAQKMEAVGRLAGGVAHDFNNLLSVILSYAELASDELKPGDPLRADLQEIHSAGKRASELTRQLLTFSRQQVIQPTILDLNGIVSGMTTMLGRLLGEDIALIAQLDPEIGPVLADAGQLEQVVMNLAVNARDAMPGGGTLTIETRRAEVGAADAHGAGRAPGAYVVLAITDTGIGMDAATRGRIFEPFFTTKQKGKGTGLGLATVFGILQQSAAYLPRAEGHASAATSKGAAVATRGTETVLLVEDEDQVRAVACAILRRHGYTVLETANGGEAYLLATQHAGPIHLLLTDVVMPRMSGRLLAEQLAATRPTMRVLFASGYTDDAIVHHGVLGAGVAFLQKPFTPDTLLRKVREVLDGGEAAQVRGPAEAPREHPTTAPRAG